MLIIINALKSITRSKGRNILIGIIVLAISASCCVALAIRNAANEAETAAAQQAAAEEEAAKLKAEQDIITQQAELEATKESLKANLNLTGSISLDRAKMMESIWAEQGDTSNSGRPGIGVMRDLMAQYQDLSLSELQKYAESEYVKDFSYAGSISLNATGDLEAYSTEGGSGGNDGNMFPDGGVVIQDNGGRGGGMVIGGMMIAQGDFTVTGYKSEAAMTKFLNGTASLKEGRMLDLSSSEMNCLISNELALFNGLSVGDTITLSNPSSNGETYTFTVVGIYTDSSSADTGNMPRFSTAQDPANLICVSHGALKSIEEHSASVAVTGKNAMGYETTTALAGQISHTFVFSGFENYEKFTEELTQKGLSEFYALTSSDLSEYTKQISEIENTMRILETSISSVEYQERLAPVQNLSKFAATLFFIVLAIGAVILIIINVFNIRERKYEVGVLTAIGIKKRKVAMQFVTELLCVTLLSIIVGAVAGAAVSVPVADSLLSDQIEQLQAQAQAEAEAAAANRNDGRPQFIQGGDRGAWQGGGMISVFGNPDETKEPVNYMDKINATFNLTILMQLLAIGVLLTFISSLAAVVFVMRYEPLKILANRS